MSDFKVRNALRDGVLRDELFRTNHLTERELNWALIQAGEIVDPDELETLRSVRDHIAAGKLTADPGARALLDSFVAAHPKPESATKVITAAAKFGGVTGGVAGLLSSGVGAVPGALVGAAVGALGGLALLMIADVD